MKILRYLWAPIALAAICVFLFRQNNAASVDEEQIWRLRNLGKAFYENPTTAAEAVEEFRKALELSPKSMRERLNYGLALLRAGKTTEAIAELQKAQAQDPSLPHTWFNLGITYKKDGDFDKAIQQFEKMTQLAPEEPVSHYNLGTLYKLKARNAEAIRQFETAAKLDENLAAPHFQLYNAYRQAGRRDEAIRELQNFQRLKKQFEGAAVPEDMEWCAYAEIYDPVDPKSDKEAARAEWKFETLALPASVDVGTAGMAVLDADGDGKPDLLVWSSKGVSLLHGGTELVKDPVLSGLTGVLSVAPGDFNNDGLADLCVLTTSGPVLLANEKGHFKKIDAQLPDGKFDKAVWLDYDHDYDLDLFLFGEKPVLLRNQGEGGFADHTADFPFAPGEAIDAITMRVVADTKGTDLIASYKDHPGVLYRDMLAGKFRAESLESLPAGARSLAAYDLDNNSFIDLAASTLSGVLFLMNSEGKFTPVSPGVSEAGGLALADLENRTLEDLVAGDKIYRSLGAGKVQPGKTPAGFVKGLIWQAADFDQDGKIDLAAVTREGSVQLALNRTVMKNQWLRVGVSGVKNLKLAPNAEIEVKSGTLYQKKIYRGMPLLFGLGQERAVETVRISWPNGLIQNEMKQPVDKTVMHEEKQRLSGSCPLIFTWNGRAFQFITDVLGVAPLGASDGEGSYFPVDHDEYVQIPAEALVERDGKYEVRMTEELREISYIDQIRLIAVDHPADEQVFTNDKWKSPPFPEFRLFGVKRRIAPVSARTGKGEDMLQKILRGDDQYADGFRRTFGGVAEMHYLDLDFGKDSAPDNRSVLVLNGWVDWADGSTFLSVAQEGRGGLITPFLQVKDANGNWKTVIQDMGMPAGKPKTMVVDLTGKFLSASREVRIGTNLCVLWNEIFLSNETSAPSGKLTELNPKTAQLRFRGFSENKTDPRRKQPEQFFYPNPMPTSLWNPTPGGYYTRYGDIRDLLMEPDDRFVIMGSGDEMRLTFDARSAPVLPAGWKRDFLLKVDGWAKDGDLNTAYSQTVEPLPFHAMSRYPYPASELFPNDELHQRWQGEYNTRPALRLIRPLTGDRTRPLPPGRDREAAQRVAGVR